jgi:hypothetical protein
MKFFGGLIAGALLVVLGFSLGKASGPPLRSRRRRHHRFRTRTRFYQRRRRRRQLEREMLAYLREGRMPPRVPQVDAEFYIQPFGTANASGTEAETPAGGKA